MSKILCYIINNEKLYLEQILAEYDYPILYTCIDKNRKRYLAMCVDPEEGRYIVAETTCQILIKMMRDSIKMIDAFKTAHRIFSVISSSNDISQDIVKPIEFSKISKDDLPEENAYFELLDSEEAIREYIRILEDEIKEDDIQHFLTFEMIGDFVFSAINQVRMSMNKAYKTYFRFQSYPIIEKTMQYKLVDSKHFEEELVYESSFS